MLLWEGLLITLFKSGGEFSNRCFEGWTLGGELLYIFGALLALSGRKTLNSSQSGSLRNPHKSLCITRNFHIGKFPFIIFRVLLTLLVKTLITSRPFAFPKSFTLGSLP